MPLQKLSVVGVEDQNQRRRQVESINSVLDHSFDDSKRKTAAEVDIGITVVNPAYPPLDVRRYGVLGDGSDELALIQSIVDVAAETGGNIYFPVPSVAYHLGDSGTGLQVAEGVILFGDTSEEVLFTYDGDGVAMNFIGTSNGLMNAYVKVSHENAYALQFGNDCRRSILRRVTAQCTHLPAADRTGTGLSLFTTSDATTFSGNFLLEQVYLLGFKYGISIDCFEIPTKTWTSIVGSQVFMVGPGLDSPGVPTVSGSRGIIMTAVSNGVGSAIYGGTIEGFDRPIEVANGGFGISYYGDIEGNASNLPILGASYCGEVVAHPSGTTYRAGANGTVNRWHYERVYEGEWDREAYFKHVFTLYNNGGNPAFWEIYRGDSRIDGGSPTRKFRIATGNSNNDAAAERNYIEVNGHKMTWGTAAPVSGTWINGDVIWNTAAVAAGSPGWVCTSPGTFSAFSDNTGDTDGSTGVITGMASTSGLAVEELVNISAGFATTGPFTVLVVTANSITVNANSNSAQSNVTVDTTDPVFKTMAAVAA